MPNIKNAQPIQNLPVEEGASMPMVMDAGSSVPGTPEERRADLENRFDNLEGNERDLNSKTLLNKNKLEEVKQETISAMFQILESMGVDPSNLESIRSFLEKLSQQDPDLAAMFEIAFNGLAKGEDFQPPVEEGLPGPEAGLPTGQPENSMRPNPVQSPLQSVGPDSAQSPLQSVGPPPGEQVEQPREMPFAPPQL